MPDENNSVDSPESIEPVKVDLPGRRLQAARENNHMSRDEIAHHLHLDVKLITALEEDDYDKLPSPSYICGYLRSYARLLKLPETEIVESYSHGQEISADLLPKNVDIVPKKHSGRSSYMPVVLLVVVLIVIFGGFWLLDIFSNAKISGSKTEAVNSVSSLLDNSGEQLSPELLPANNNELITPDGVADTMTGTEPEEITEFKKKNAPRDENVQASAGQVKSGINIAAVNNLLLTYEEDSWTEVVDSNGKQLVYRLVVKGTELALEGKPPYKILLGNAPAVKVLYKGNLFDHKRFQRDRIAYFRLGSVE